MPDVICVKVQCGGHKCSNLIGVLPEKVRVPVFCNMWCKPRSEREAEVSRSKARNQERINEPVKQYPDGLVDTVGLAKILGCSYQTIRNRMDEGKIKPAGKAGRTILWDEADCKKKLNFRSIESCSADPVGT